MGTGSFPGVKQPGRGVDHPPPSSTEIEVRVEVYLYSTSGPLWPVKGWTLPLPNVMWLGMVRKRPSNVKARYLGGYSVGPFSQSIAQEELHLTSFTPCQWKKWCSILLTVKPTIYCKYHFISATCSANSSFNNWRYCSAFCPPSRNTGPKWCHVTHSTVTCGLV